MLGFAPALLGHLQFLMEANYPGVKITPSGFTKMLIENNPKMNVSSVNGVKMSDLKRSTIDGHIRDVRLKFLPRIKDDQIADVDNCDNDFGFQYTETTLETPQFSKAGFQLEWGFVEQYQSEASNIASIGDPATGVLQEMVDQIMHTVNGLITNIDKKLMNSVTFGVNVSTGNALAKDININKDGTVLGLSDGMTEILSDVADNEFVGDALMSGSGIFNKYQIARANIGINSAGLNIGSQSGYQWFFDLNSATPFGTNHVGVFAKGAVGFVDLDRYIAWKTGAHGNSTFFTMKLPVESTPGGAPTMMNFNVQIKEVDCPTEAFDGYETRTMGRGYQIFISKQFGLFQQPTSAFQTGDRLEGNNGSLLYNITNNCDPCPVPAAE